MYDENDDMNQQDFFGDGDLAQPENLPLNVRFIGKVTKVDFIEKSNPGDNSPDIKVSVVTRAKENGEALDPESNYRLGSDLSFWRTGQYAPDSRRALARLVMTVLGLDEDAMRTTPLTEGAKQLVGGYVTYEVKYRKFTTREGEEVFAQDFKKVKAATPEQIASLS